MKTKSNRLIVFGCSYTYGQGLKDCLEKVYFGIDLSAPSKLGWAQMLADSLNLELINKSRPGSSNFEILLTLLEFDFKHNDSVVIMWSHSVRDMIFTRLWKFLNFRRRLLVGKNNRLTRKWIDDTSEQDYFMKTWIYMDHASLKLDRAGIKKYIHYPVDPELINKYKLNFININNLHLNGIDWIDLADDNAHPGPMSNRSTFEKIYKILNES